MSSVVFEDSDLVESLSAFVNRTADDERTTGRSSIFAMVERAHEPFNAGDVIIAMPHDTGSSPALTACVLDNAGDTHRVVLPFGHPALERTIVRPLRKGERMVVYP